MLVTGCTEFANQVLMVNTARLESAATGALLIMAFDIVVTYLAQILIFQVPNWKNNSKIVLIIGTYTTSCDV